MTDVASLVERIASTRGDRPAIDFDGSTYTYRELDRLAGRLASALARAGVRAGDRVALLLPNCPEFPISYLATQKIGAVAASLSTMSTTRELDVVLRDCRPQALIVDGSLLDRVPPGLVPVVFVHGQSGDGFRSLAAALEGPDSDGARRPVPADHPAAILYTSGTTGVPKGATLSQANVVTNAAAAARCYEAGGDDRFLLYLPLFHCFGQNAIMNAAFSAGACIVLQRRFAAESVLDVVRSGSITHFFGVPSVYVRLLQVGVDSRDFHRVRYVFSAAAPLSIELAKQWRSRTGHVIQEGYGLTETSPFATYNHCSRHRLGSVGTPIDGVRVRVVGENGVEVAAGELGEIEISGPNVMLGYWDQPEFTASAVKDGWFRTGDIGRLDSDGYLFVVDRLKEMINVSGFKVYPSEVEHVLQEHPAVSELAVFGVPHPTTGEAVHAHVVLKPERSAGVDDLRRFCADQLATYKIPSLFWITDSLPKSPAGKVLRRVLRDQARSHSDRPR